MNWARKPETLQFEEGIEKTVQWYLDNSRSGWIISPVVLTESYYEDMYKNRSSSMEVVKTNIEGVVIIEPRLF